MTRASEELTVLRSGHIEQDQDLEGNLLHCGFRVTISEPDQVAGREGVSGVPTFEVTAPNQKVAYVGGYRPRGQKEQFVDQAVLAGLLMGKQIQRLPVYGCATSTQMSRLLDPLGLKILFR